MPLRTPLFLLLMVIVFLYRAIFGLFFVFLNFLQCILLFLKWLFFIFNASAKQIASSSDAHQNFFSDSEKSKTWIFDASWLRHNTHRYKSQALLHDAFMHLRTPSLSPSTVIVFLYRAIFSSFLYFFIFLAMHSFFY